MKISLFLILLILTACQPSEKLEGPFTVTRVIDGDTFVINTDEKIRISGINTPEKKECHFSESKNKLEELLLNKEVYLERDFTNKGKYGRLLRYVHSNEGEINFILIQEGYAKVYNKYAYDTKKYSEMKRAEQAAKTNKLGVWSCPE